MTYCKLHTAVIYLNFTNHLLAYNASICHSCVQHHQGMSAACTLPGNDCRAHNNSFMFHFPSKLSSSVRQMNFQVAESSESRYNNSYSSSYSFSFSSSSSTWPCSPPTLLLPPKGTPMQMFSYSFWLLVSFSDKTKTNKHSVRQQEKQLAGEE